MTPRPRAPTLRAVANLTITLSPEQYARVLSLVPANEAERFCITAIDEAIARRRNVATKQEEPKIVGRPPKAAGRRQVTLQIEQDLLKALDVLKALDAIASKRKVSRSDVANLVIKAGISDVT